MKPWREVIHPHPDVLGNTFQQSEFAADISAVRSGDAPNEYKLAGPFFARTFVTQGMGQLLEQVARRLGGHGGEPVIQLQTAFGGGKTHTLWAGLADVPRATVAVLDGTKHSPGQPWKCGRTTVNTLWGELAHQLGGVDAFAKVKQADATGTSPGKEMLRELLAAAAPCVVLIDELAVYLRQFELGKVYTGGSFDSNLSFVQALTEAAKLVPTAAVLASLPDSKSASSGDRGAKAITALEHIFGRVQALWRPVSVEEGFEVVRRRLFEPVRDAAARDAVCRAFADLYREQGGKLPSETQEGRYADRLGQAYPIHPEVFDRLYDDWATLEGFQRTRGVLKLMAKVVHRLWADGNTDPMILPGSLPLSDRDVRAEMTYLLPAGWESVIEGDIDGDRSEAAELETREPRLGQVNAARRVGRTLFLGTAPGSAATKPGVRGLDRARVLLGCLQPGQPAAVYTDALGRLADRLHYLNSTGDKSQDATRYWLDTRANLRREMEDRKARLGEKPAVRQVIKDAAEKEFRNVRLFDGLHVFTPPADVPDDSALRLVVLQPESGYEKDEKRTQAVAVVDTYRLEARGGPRHRANRLLFLTADRTLVPRLLDVARTALAWASIVDDVEQGKLVIDTAQKRQAEKEKTAAAAAVPRATRECYRWLLAPTQETPTADRPTVEAYSVPTSGGTAVAELEQVCKENELVIEVWAPVHLRTRLKELYWTDGRTAAAAKVFWEDTQRYLYLPRLRELKVLEQVVRTGAASKDFFGTAYGQSGDKFEGFSFASTDVSLDDSLLLIEPEVARAYAIREKSLVVTMPPEATGSKPGLFTPPGSDHPAVPHVAAKPAVGQPKATVFHGTVDVSAATAKLKLAQVADDLIAVLANDPHAVVRVTVEVEAEFPGGVPDNTRRAVDQNALHLGFKSANWD